MKAALLCVLLLLTPADDALLPQAPGPEDGAWAAQNNEFLAEAGLVPGERPVRGSGAPGLPAQAGALGLPLPPSGRFARTALSLLPGTVPLYLFMSLQR